MCYKIDNVFYGSIKRTMITVIDFSTDNIESGSPKVNQNGGKNISLQYKLNEMARGVVFQTPLMLSFGINKWQDPKNPNMAPAFSTTLSFVGSEQNEKLRDFHGVLQRLDQWAIETAIKNGWEWFGRKNMSRETIESIYTPIIKVSLEKASGAPSGKPDYMKLKLKTSASGYSTAFYNKNKEIIPSGEVDGFFTKGSHVRALVQCTGVWIAAGKFGLSWKVIQMVVEPRAVIGNQYAFEDDE